MNSGAIDKCLKAIERAKKLKNLNMLLTETYDFAFNQAKNNTATGNLANTLMTVKDNFNTRDIETTCGSKALIGYIPPFDATVVQKLLEAGTLLLGKTNMDEFGMGSVSESYAGAVKNPWNLNKKRIEDLNDKNNKKWYISGGSSGGSAATVTSDVAEFSIGSDTGGSVRNPAAICGCIGYKPTYGLVSRHGLIPLNNYFDTVGILSKSMETIVNVLNQIAGPDENDATTIRSDYKKVKLYENFDISKLRFGIPQEFYPAGLTDNNHRAWEDTIKLISTKGNAKILEASLPYTPYSMSCYSILTSCEVASNFARYDGLRYGYRPNVQEMSKEHESESFETLLKKTRNHSFGQVVKGRVASGNYFLLKENYEKYFLKSQKIRKMIKEDFNRVFDSNVDILITPTCFSDTPTYEEYLKSEGVFDEKDFFTVCANISGVPAISIPAGISDNGLPIGVQFIANVRNDELLLNVANWFSKNNSSNFNYLKIDL